jgi:non-heme chloroperoxidase
MFADATPPPAIQAPAPVRQQRLALPTGVELDVIESGDPAGVPLILLHGISDSAPSMRPLMNELPAGIRAIAITQRGHGDSDKPAGPYTTDAFVADAVAVMDRLGVKKGVVLGHSMGSVVAQRLAVTHPERLSGLILEGAFPTLANNPDVKGFYDGMIAPLTGPLDPATAREFQVSTMARPVPPAFLELVVAESQKLPAHAWKAILQDMMAADRSDDLRGLRVPTLILWGDQDAFTKAEHQKVLTEKIAGSRLHVFEGTGHDPHWEEPAAAARLIADFTLRNRF